MEKLDRSGENIAQGSEVNPWQKMADEAPSFEEKMASGRRKEAEAVNANRNSDIRGPKDYIVNRFLNGLEFSGVSYDVAERKVVSEDGNIAAYMKDQAEIYGVDAVLKANESLSGGMKLTTQEHNNELAERVYADLSDKSRAAKLDAEDGEAMKYNMISDALVEIENFVKVDEESGDVQTLDSAARHLILKENRQYLRAIKNNRLTEKDEQQYNLRIALIEEVRRRLKGGEELLADERSNQDVQEREGAGDSEFEAVEKLELNSTLEQEKKRQEDEARAERMRKYEEDRQRKKQQELDELQKRAARQASRKSEEQQSAEAKVKQQEYIVGDALQGEKQPISYQIETGMAADGTTITVGQEIPESWFKPKIVGDGGKGGFGISINQPPIIESYLSDILNIEFSKLSQNERSHYDYASAARMIKEEARRTKRIPDIAAIIKMNRK